MNFGQSENFILFSLVLFHPPSWIIVQSDDCFSICHLKFLSNHRPSCHLELLSNQKTAFHPPSCIFDQRRAAPPPHPPSWHRTLTFTLLAPFIFDLLRINSAVGLYWTLFLISTKTVTSTVRVNEPLSGGATVVIHILLRRLSRGIKTHWRRRWDEVNRRQDEEMMSDRFPFNYKHRNSIREPIIVGTPVKRGRLICVMVLRVVHTVWDYYCRNSSKTSRSICVMVLRVVHTVWGYYCRNSSKTGRSICVMVLRVVHTVRGYYCRNCSKTDRSILCCTKGGTHCVRLLLSELW